MSHGLKKDLTKAFMVYIIIQGVIDILNSFFLLQLNTSLTPGLVIRNVVLILAILYILFIEKEHITYLLSLGGFFALHLVANFYLKENMDIFQEIAYLAKYLYFLVLLISANHIYQLSHYPNIKEKLIKSMSIAMTIICITIILGALTATGIKSYGSEKIGQTGYFFSGTKISAAMAILFPVFLMDIIIDEGKSLPYKLIFTISTISAMFITGTKTSYMGIVIGLITAIFVLLAKLIAKRRVNSRLLIGLVFILIAVIIYTPFSPVYNNMRIHESWDISARPDMIFNGREIKEDLAKEDFIKSELIRKFIGLGYGGDYMVSEQIAPIEREFHELLFYYGIIGFVLLLYYPLVQVAKGIKSYIKYYNVVAFEDGLLFASLALGLGCSFIAGHVLFAPSVSIYLVCVLAILNNRGELK